MGKIVRKSLKIIFGVCAALALVLAILFYFLYVNAKTVLLNNEQKALTQTTEKITTALLGYTSSDILLAFARLPETQEHLRAIRNAALKGFDSPEYIKSSDAFSSFALPFQKELSMQRIVFASAEGRILYTTDSEEIGYDLFKSPFDNEAMAASMIRSLLTWTQDVSQYVFNSVAETPELYLSTPLELEKRFFGVLAIALNPQPIDNIVLSPELIEKKEVVTLLQLQNQEIVVLSPAPHALEQAFRLTMPYDPFLQNPISAAMNGQNGSGIATSLHDEKVIAHWSFIPKLNWGIITQTDYEIALARLAYLKTLAQLFAIAVPLFVIALCLCKEGSFRAIVRGVKHPLFFRLTAGTIMALALIGVGYTIYLLKNEKQKVLQNVEETAQRQIREAAAVMARDPAEIASTVNWMADDLRKGRLKKEDLAIRLKRDLIEVPSLQKVIVAYSPESFALEATRQGKEVDTKVLPPSFFRTPESSQFLKGEHSIWLPPHADLMTNHPISIYTTPFPGGVIAAFYDLDSIQARAESLSVGPIGTGFIMQNDGKLLSTSNNTYMLTITPLLTSEIRKSDRFIKWYDEQTQEWVYLLFEPIPDTPWCLGFVFKESDVAVPMTLYRNTWLMLIACAVLFSLAFTALLCHIFSQPPRRLQLFCDSATVLLLIGLAAIWVTVYNTSTIPRTQGTIIQDSIDLDNFLNRVKREAARQFLPEPTVIPTGILIEQMAFPSENGIPFAGLVWQKAPLSSLATGVIFPHAAKVIMKQVLSEKTGGKQTFNWRFSGILEQKNDLREFPFDPCTIKIEIASKESNSDVLLVPDLEAYHNYTTKSIVWLSPAINFPGYVLERTFFTLEASKGSANSTLNFNIFLTRKLVFPILFFFLPFALIQIGLYILFLMTNRESLNLINSVMAYIIALFSMGLLQTTMRHIYYSDHILYGETFYLAAYFILFLLLCHAFVMKHFSKESLIGLWIRANITNLFWPFVLALWFVIALLFFYAP